MNFCLSCAKCCYNTEMELSKQDIKRIEDQNTLGLKRDDFCFKTDGFFKLKNKDNHCIFLDPDTNYCKIYLIRPTGCKFYPLIFNQEKNKCVIDDDCPYKKYAQMDQYQRLEIMLTISDEQAIQMINSCSKLMIHCNSTVIHLEKSKWEVAAI